MVNEDHLRFEKDIRGAGYDVFYHDFQFKGIKPAIKCREEELHHVKRSTTVKINWKRLGFGILVFPE